MLTTIDNPYDPFDQFDEWYSYDERHGYHTCSYLARIAKSASDLSADDQIFAVNSAIDEILEHNFSGLYKKVVRKFKTIP